MQFFLITQKMNSDFITSQDTKYSILSDTIGRLSTVKNLYIEMIEYYNNNPTENNILNMRRIQKFHKALLLMDKIEEKKLFSDIDLFLTVGYSEDSQPIQELLSTLQEMDYSTAYKEHNQNIVLSSDNLINAISEDSFYLRGSNRVYHSDTFILGLKYSRNQLDRIIKRLVKMRESIYN